MPVARHVAVLAADHEDDRGLVERVRDRAARGGLGMEEPALAEVARLALGLDADPAPVDEVELVLHVVVVREALVTRWVVDGVDAEPRDAEGRANLAEAEALAELVEGREGVAHSWHAVRDSGSRLSSSSSANFSSRLKREPKSSSTSAETVSRATALDSRPASIRTA